jgi:hypothetical protein
VGELDVCGTRVGIVCFSCFVEFSATTVVPDASEESEGKGMEDKSNAWDLALAGSRSIETNGVRAVPLFCETDRVRRRQKRGESLMEAHDFVLDEFIWAVDELFHLGFPNRSIPLEGSTREPEGEVFDLGKRVEFERMEKKGSSRAGKILTGHIPPPLVMWLARMSKHSSAR